jgi:hypothetical protein
MRSDEGIHLVHKQYGSENLKCTLVRLMHKWEKDIETYLRGKGRKWAALDLAGSVEGPMTVFCKHGDGPSGYVEAAYF